VDEDWNMEFWGHDELGLKRRAYRFAEMTAAARVLIDRFHETDQFGRMG
jgi:chaperone required for assembly of F1-ATPase